MLNTHTHSQRGAMRCTACCACAGTDGTGQAITPQLAALQANGFDVYSLVMPPSDRSGWEEATQQVGCVIACRMSELVPRSCPRFTLTAPRMTQFCAATASVTVSEHWPCRAGLTCRALEHQQSQSLRSPCLGAPCPECHASLFFLCRWWVYWKRCWLHMVRPATRCAVHALLREEDKRGWTAKAIQPPATPAADDYAADTMLLTAVVVVVDRRMAPRLLHKGLTWILALADGCVPRAPAAAGGCFYADAAAAAGWH